MTTRKRVGLSFAALATCVQLLPPATYAACNATVNGRPMTVQECAIAIQVYGGVVPGDYRVDANGNWSNANNAGHRGNSYTDRSTGRGGAWGSTSPVGPSTVYDPSGGCEGGNCVNIVW